MKEILSLDQHKVVTLIGSGGKTTIMYYLAQESVSATKRVLITTTTKIFYLPEDRDRFIKANNYQDWEARLAASVSRDQYLVTGQDVQHGKIIGVPAEWVDQLAQSGLFDLILVEGDGSFRKPLKAPRESEPVVPNATTLLLPIIGLSGFRGLLSETLVHRSEIFAQLTGLKEGDQIRPEDICRVFFHPQGYYLSGYDTSKVIPIFNQADNLVTQELGIELATLFLQAGLKQALVTSFKEGKANWRVYK